MKLSAENGMARARCQKIPNEGEKLFMEAQYTLINARKQVARIREGLLVYTRQCFQCLVTKHDKTI